MTESIQLEEQHIPEHSKNLLSPANSLIIIIMTYFIDLLGEIVVLDCTVEQLWDFGVFSKGTLKGGRGRQRVEALTLPFIDDCSTSRATCHTFRDHIRIIAISVIHY